MVDKNRIQLLQGTLDLLVLRSLVFRPQHGHGIATSIQRSADDELLIDHGSLYPALQRLERANLISSDWGVSENNRRARYYTLTSAGRRRLVAETERWETMVRVISRVLKAREA
jgi:transcriptional regulator